MADMKPRYSFDDAVSQETRQQSVSNQDTAINQLVLALQNGEITPEQLQQYKRQLQPSIMDKLGQSVRNLTGIFSQVAGLQPQREESDIDKLVKLQTAELQRQIQQQQLEKGKLEIAAKQQENEIARKKGMYSSLIGKSKNEVEGALSSSNAPQEQPISVKPQIPTNIEPQTPTVEQTNISGVPTRTISSDTAKMEIPQFEEEEILEKVDDMGNPIYKRQLTQRGEAQKKQWEESVKESAKIQSEKEKNIIKAQSGADSINMLFDKYDEAYDELEKALPNVGASGVMGGIDRLKAGAGMSGFLSLYPKAASFDRWLNLASYKIAREIEGGRVTDQDVKIVLNSLFSLTGGSREMNLELAKTQVENLKAKGADASWADNMINRIEKQIEAERLYETLKSEGKV